MRGVNTYDQRLRSYYNDPNYLYRTHPFVKLQEVPTLIAFDKMGPIGALIEHDCEDDVTVLF